MTTRLEKVIREVKLLPADEQQKLREVLDQLAAPNSQMTEEEFERRLLERGIISELRPPITDFTRHQGREPVEAEGRPVSEIIIEERR